MSSNSRFAKILRFFGILMMGLTAGFTLLGGIGTSCAALFPTNWESMAPLAALQWLYILFVLVGIGLGILGIRATDLAHKRDGEILSHGFIRVDCRCCSWRYPYLCFACPARKFYACGCGGVHNCFDVGPLPAVPDPLHLARREFYERKCQIQWTQPEALQP